MAKPTFTPPPFPIQYYMSTIKPPAGFVYPTITLDQALERGETAESLMAVARWNESKARGGHEFRRKRQARELRAVAAQLRQEDVQLGQAA